MEYYPVFLKLEGKKCLVVGGGDVAERKVEALARCQADIHVVSPELTPGLQKMSASGRIQHRAGFYRNGDLDGAFLVVSAANDDSVNRTVAADCAARNIMINVVDDPDRCSFVVPSVVHRGPFKLAISTGGNSPQLARVIREQLEKEFGPQYGDFVNFLGRIREQARQNIGDPGRRRDVLNNLVDQVTLDMLKQGETERAKERVRNVCPGSGCQS
ncbi:MAG: bifunctional precorrin-2 dehydrogenase/sirohydrochlorin ferrochelatase [Firmicutes bacterium]|nr:bifunctional precorrin-2 dehydrogenase/sirohydrochlorin ferrochelatase [Bacillota bacterium]